jgi:integrase
MPVQGHSLELLLFVERPGPKGLLPSAFSMVTALRLCYTSKSVTVRIGWRAISMENLRLREAAPTSVNVTVGRRSREYLTEREVERLIEAAKQNRSGHRDATAILVAYRHGLRASEIVALRWDEHRPRHRALACAQGQGWGCQRASDIGQGKSGTAQAPARSPNVTIRLHLGTSRTAFRSRISAHGGQGGRRCEIHLPRSFPHAAARLRVQARQRRARHSRHPGLSRAPFDHVHRPVHGFDAQSVQAFLEGLAFCLA